MTYRIEVPATVWRAACGSVSTDASRPVINGAYVQREGKRLTVTATDGHQLAQFTGPVGADETGDDVAVILPPVKLSAVGVTSAKADRSTVILEGDGDTWTVTAFVSPFRSDRSVNVRAIEGPFPNVKAVFPSYVGGTVTRFAFSTQVLEKLTGAWGCGVAFDFCSTHADSRSIVVTPDRPIADAWETLALLMPLRVNLFPACVVPTLPVPEPAPETAGVA